MSMGRSGMGVGGNFGQMLADNGEIVQDYNNEKVQQIRMQLGEFDYNQNANMSINHNQLEFRGMQTLDNYARYEGQWIKGTDIR